MVKYVLPCKLIGEIEIHSCPRFWYILVSKLKKWININFLNQQHYFILLLNGILGWHLSWNVSNGLKPQMSSPNFV